MAPRETENNAYAKFWGDKQRALWYVMIFSGVFNFIFQTISTCFEIVCFDGFRNIKTKHVFLG